MALEVKTTESETSWTSVCDLSELTEDMGHCALVEKKQVALFRLSGIDDIFAVDNFDPFSKANVLSRGIVGDLKGELVVASPVYKQHFNLVTGQCIEDEDVKIATYAVRLVDGVVQVSVSKSTESE